MGSRGVPRQALGSLSATTSTDPACQVTIRSLLNQSCINFYFVKTTCVQVPYFKALKANVKITPCPQDSNTAHCSNFHPMIKVPFTLHFNVHDIYFVLNSRKCGERSILTYVIYGERSTLVFGMKWSSQGTFE